jgi:hypothetical protein
MKQMLLLIVACSLWSSSAFAQTVTNPTVVNFTASPDHNTVVGGIPLLDHYDLLLITGGTTVTAFTQGLAKPTPNASNVISVPLSSGFVAAMTPNTLYTATLNAVGNGGTSSAPADRPFARLGPPAPGTNVQVR